MSPDEKLPQRPEPVDAAPETVPVPWEAPHLPPEAEKMGLMPITAPELAFASALRPDKRLHKFIAWIGLAVMAVSGLSGVVAWVRGLGY